MSLNPIDARIGAQTVADLVRDVEDRLILEIAKTASKNLGAKWYSVRRFAEVAAFRARIEYLLGRDWNEVLDQAQRVLDMAADAGQGQARMDIRAQMATGNINPTLDAQTVSGLSAIAADTLKNLTGLPALILRDAVDAYQKAMATPVTEVALGAVTRLQATEDALQEFASRGIKSFMDKSGRRWRIDSYAEMAVRTGAMRAMRHGYDQTLTNSGLDLVMVTGHAYTCSKCAPWQGSILSLTGQTPTGTNLLPSTIDPDQKVRVRVDGTMDQAKAEGLFHPNCEHSYSLYLPGVSKPYPKGGDGDQHTYDASQKQRALEREIRKKERELAAALTPETATKKRSEIRRLQAKIRDLLADHPKLQRLRYREQNMKAALRFKRTKPAPGKPASSQKPKPLEDPLYKLERTKRGKVKPGKVTIPPDLSKPPEPHELATAQTLASYGVDVAFRKEEHGDHVKNPDVTMFGQIWEFKGPKGAGKDTISKQFRRAKKQSGRLVIDLARCGLSDDFATGQIIRRFKGQAEIQKLIIVDKEKRLKILRHTDKLSS
ncbi:hypothetical protein G7Y41_08795 [Schaalia sp. ZJ405]|uniref:phage minor capsid protein n=1 Tax=Schaalia sp. ZJ405 TaxID=2709403 RepID=UPI0013EC57D9|nr:phage minor capsid protein [Schaalia sp. ZJ405]QPK81122.1 hypothetical protein G7Y41_08795 [Schaalia sp. ZJ405]